MANMIPPEMLLDFYREGIFPMAMDDEIRLYDPDPRGVLPLEEFRIPHGTKKRFATRFGKCGWIRNSRK